VLNDDEDDDDEVVVKALEVVDANSTTASADEKIFIVNVCVCVDLV
jgi:hypothetical protein